MNTINVWILTGKNKVKNLIFFCLQFNRSVLAQLYDIYFVEFLGNILKTLSNCLMAMISLDRYFLLKGNMQIEKLYSKWKKSLCSGFSPLGQNMDVQNYYFSREFPIKYFFRAFTQLVVGRHFSNEIEETFMFSYIIFLKIERNELHIRIDLIFHNIFAINF
ncbi:hypothetical protein BpHYR1_053469 [Brachionus plicatilis]|uniref:Uncharacterized protein n=1 Tax=Brachionus plicatilis TaxID=10195 RepID=A0A3M7RTQ3_BRAPC|nr:hypothetical protein BpHYR1_053469 [Brachionus plicatilis]